MREAKMLLQSHVFGIDFEPDAINCEEAPEPAVTINQNSLVHHIDKIIRRFAGVFLLRAPIWSST
jgi:hypothetical protein